MCSFPVDRYVLRNLSHTYSELRVGHTPTYLREIARLGAVVRTCSKGQECGATDCFPTAFERQGTKESSSWIKSQNIHKLQIMEKILENTH